MDIGTTNVLFSCVFVRASAHAALRVYIYLSSAKYNEESRIINGKCFS